MGKEDKKPLRKAMLPGILLILLILCMMVGLQVQHAKLPPNVGNSDENIKSITANTDPNNFTFMVFGDIKHGLGTFGNLLDIAKGDDPAFVLIDGDFSSDVKPIEHKYFCHVVGRKHLNFPILLAVGNHDVEPNTAFEIEQFNELYGASDYHFTIGENLFVVLNNAPGFYQSGEYISYLDKAAADNPQAKHILVFMHIPVAGLNDWGDCAVVSNSDEFKEVCEKYKVDYVFMGHHHGYVKTVIGPTTYLVCGGGGSPLRAEHGNFHHLIRMAYSNGQWTETAMAVAKGSETGFLMERNAAVYFWPWVIENKARTLGFAFIIVILVLLTLKPFMLSSCRSRGEKTGIKDNEQTDGSGI